MELDLQNTFYFTFPPSFPAAPGRPGSPGGPGVPGCPRSPIGPVPPVGPYEEQCRHMLSNVYEMFSLHLCHDMLITQI